ncbi:MAG TPA: class I SAM-dependent methyltransferase [Burkholderiales bacterium]|nr:class I SAM-dependent methyltransferase [Burkholderiales bacterium]
MTSRCDRRTFLARALLGGFTALAANCGPGRAFAQTLESPRTRMTAGEFSATARGAALNRAVHQIIDYPRVLDDPFALPILGPLRPGELQAAVDRQSPALRASIALRSRYAEDRLAAAVARDVRQYVILGAGLDTFAYRNPHRDSGLHVFEVDHPATQRFKRERVQTAGIAVPPQTTFVPIDFETQTLSRELAVHGFRFDEPAFFSLLGVVIYLTDAAVMETMRSVASCASGSEIVFSFSVPDSLLSERQRLSRERSMMRVAALGEPWISFYDPPVLARTLRARGFGSTELFGPEDANRTYFADRLDGLRMSAGHMMSARI